MDADGLSAVDRHWHPEDKAKPLVYWKDPMDTAQILYSYGAMSMFVFSQQTHLPLGVHHAENQDGKLRKQMSHLSLQSHCQEPRMVTSMTAQD